MHDRSPNELGEYGTERESNDPGRVDEPGGPWAGNRAIAYGHRLGRARETNWGRVSFRHRGLWLLIGLGGLVYLFGRIETDGAEKASKSVCTGRRKSRSMTLVRRSGRLRCLLMGACGGGDDRGRALARRLDHRRVSARADRRVGVAPICHLFA